MNPPLALIIVGFLVLVVTGGTEGIKCWFCENFDGKNTDCNIPKLSTDVKQVECPGPDFRCTKRSYAGTFFPNIVRTCIDKFPATAEGCRDVINQEEAVSFFNCFCLTDLCNDGWFNFTSEGYPSLDGDLKIPRFFNPSPEDSFKPYETGGRGGGERGQVGSFILLASIFILGNMVWKYFERIGL